MDNIINEVHSHGVKTAISGATYSPSKLWFRWLKTWIVKDVTVIVGDENIYVQPGKMGGLYRGVYGFKPNDKEGFEQNKNNLIREFGIVRKVSVIKAEFKKEHFWNIHGIVNIQFNDNSIRKDQQEVQSYGCISIDHIRKSAAQALIDTINIG